MKYFLLLFPALLFSQTYKIHGIILDDSTQLVLSYATIRVAQTDIVTSSNKEGEFLLELSEGNYSLVVTYVGYHNKTISISVPHETSLNIGLVPALIQLPEVTVHSNMEDPAMEIMREAIKRREKNYEGLKNYEVTGYKKNIFYSSERIAMIDEKFVKQIYEKGKMSKEFVLSTHKTDNIKSTNMNISISIGLSLFFVNGDLNIKIGSGKSNVIFPLADNAIKYYDFKLLNSKVAGKEVSHTIQIIPRSSVEPLMKGTIIIDDATFALIGANVETGQGWNIPFAKGFSMKIQQAYSNYNGFWIPQYSEVELSGELSVMGGLLSMDRMKISEVFSASTCKANGTIPDSIKNARRSKYGGYTADTSKMTSKLLRYRKTKTAPNPIFQTYQPAVRPVELNSIAIDSLRPLPLTVKEKIAFAELDSTQTMDKLIQPKGALSVLSSSSSDSSKSLVGTLFSAFMNYGILHNDRVEGVTPGVYFDIDSMNMNYFYNGSLAYSSGAKIIEWKIGGGYNFDDDHLDRLDMNVWSDIRPWQSSYNISKTINSVGFTLLGQDYFNYYRSTGFNIGIHKYFTDTLYAKIYFQSEKESSVSENSFVSLKKDRRVNPAIVEGTDNALRFEFGYDPTGLLSFRTLSPFALKIFANISHPFIGSDFNYQQTAFLVNARFNTIYSTMFLAPYFRFVIEGGIVSGSKYEIQHLFMPSASFSIYSPVGVLKGVQPYEFAGEKYFMFQGEHNWQSLPFMSLGFADAGLQIITGGSIANVWNTNTAYSIQNNWKPYWETYIGVGNIFDLLRVDVIWNSKEQTFVKLGISSAALN